MADDAAHVWRRETDDFGLQQRRSFYAADDGCTFRYVGLTLRPRQEAGKAGARGVPAWSPELGAIRDRVDRVTHAILAGRADKLGPDAAAALQAEMSAPAADVPGRTLFHFTFNSDMYTTLFGDKARTAECEEAMFLHKNGVQVLWFMYTKSGMCFSISHSTK